MSRFIIETNDKMFSKLMLTSLIKSIIYAVVGLIVLIYPGFTNKVISIFMGILCFLGGAELIFKFIKRDGSKIYKYNIVFGSLLIILGLVLILVPDTVTYLITACLGVFLIIDGVVKITYSAWLKIASHPSWLITMVIGIMLTIFGILAILNPFSSLSITSLVGLFIILSSILDITDVILFKKRSKEVSDLFW